MTPFDDRTARRTRWALAALALGAFVVGTAELLIVGILDLVARGTGVSVSSAGTLVTAYALGIALGAPLLAAVTAKVGRRLLLFLALGAFALGNVVAAVATSFDLLLLARVLTGTIHGLFIGVASVLAAGLVPPERRGQAISMVFGGIAVSTVVGVPAGTLLGQSLGWHAAFVVVVALAVLALIASLLLVPPVETGQQPGLRTEAPGALAPRVLAMLAVGLVIMGAQFTAFTYLTPFLRTVTHISGSGVSLFLLVFGIAAAVGTFLGGQAADRNPTLTLVGGNIALAGALLLLSLVGSSPVLVGVVLAVWGFVGFGLVPSFQLRVISLAGAGADLAATLGASAVNGGIAAGSLIGGAVLSRYGVTDTVRLAALLCAVAIPATWATRFLATPGNPYPSDHHEPARQPVTQKAG